MTGHDKGADCSVVTLQASRHAEVVEVLSDAFYDYPVMTFTAGTSGPEYDRLLHLMVDVFTASRFLRDYPVLGITNKRDEILAVANINPPRSVPFPPELKRRYEALARALGPDGNARLTSLSDTWKEFTVDTPHYHLGMIGVRRSHQGRGHARRLLDVLHGMSQSDPESSGVSLTTETRNNVPLYQRFGYEIIGHRRLEGLETWGMFRANS